MEGYFVRTLGMHRVYNSAFMNMLKNEENAKYRATIKNTMEFDPEILKRFVNFMNNPDEETAVAQFGKGDKYFGICTLLVTMPGLPMFGHGQVEGFEEKYGMEYRRSYRDEQPDGYLVGRHEHEIFPLMKRRYLFSGSAMFRIYDLYCNGSVNENVFAYTNRVWTGGGEEKALIFYNNSYYETSGWINVSDPEVPDGTGKRRDKLSEALAIHGEGNYFTLLREQKSNLWYIRSSKAICENGFFVGLKGYETQVYLDIYEVEDNAKGRWARLNNDLNGRGVPDPLVEIKNIFLGELYYRFTELFKPEIITSLCDIKSKTSSVESLKELVEAFAQTASKFITGANGTYDEWIARDEEGVICKFTPVDKNVVWKECEAFINRMAKLKDALKKPATPFFKDISECISKRPMLCAVMLSYGIVSLLRPIIGKEANGKHAASLAFDHWDFGRKMREIYHQFGASEADTWRITDIARVVLSKTRPIVDKKPGKNSSLEAAEFAALIIEENYLDEDFRRILGINIFDDVAWFNKEGFEAALFYSSLFFMLESDSVVKIPIDERIDRIAKIYDVLVKAEKKSGYRFDVLIDSLTVKSTGKIASVKKTAGTKKEEKGSVKSGAKKSTGAKKAAAKTGAKSTKAKKPIAKKPVEKSSGVKKEKKTSVKSVTKKKTEAKKGVKPSSKPKGKKK